MTKGGEYNGNPERGNTCSPCPDKYTCAGGTADKEPQTGQTPSEETPDDNQCGDDYVGSLYHKLARYAMQACVRPSEASKPDSQIPATVLQDINVVMDQIRIDMAKTLSAECERLDGIWVNTVWVNKLKELTCFDGQCFTQVTKPTLNTNLIPSKEIVPTLHTTFYNETSSNTQWGYCATKTTTTDTASTEEIKKEQPTNEAESSSQDQTGE